MVGLFLGLSQTQLPDGPGKDLLEQRCTACHSLDSTTSKKLGQSEWNQIVSQMVSLGAQLSPTEREGLVEYLAANFGSSASNRVASIGSEGAFLYQNNCNGCHQAAGNGVQGAFPPLARHVSVLLKAGGRDYLGRVLINGLQGPINVSGFSYNGVMPKYETLKDTQIAALLNYISTTWGNSSTLPPDYKPYTAEEIKFLRNLKLSPTQMLLERAKLELPKF